MKTTTSTTTNRRAAKPYVPIWNGKPLNPVFKKHNFWKCEQCNPDELLDPFDPKNEEKLKKWKESRAKASRLFYPYTDDDDSFAFPDPKYFKPWQGDSYYDSGIEETHCCGLSDLSYGGSMNPGCLEVQLNLVRERTGAIIATATNANPEQLRYAKTLRALGFKEVGKSQNVNHPTHVITTFYKAFCPPQRKKKKQG